MSPVLCRFTLATTKTINDHTEQFSINPVFEFEDTAIREVVCEYNSQIELTIVLWD